MSLIELSIAFFFVSLLYSSIGFGGGSSYLALLALSSYEFRIMRLIALFCNIIVVSGSTLIFYRSGLLNLKKSMGLVLFSVPMAFLGGTLKISESSFFILLAISLFIAGLWVLIQKERKEMSLTRIMNNRFNILCGSAIGFLSGIVGIGGGIFLSPILHITAWDKSKVIAATSSFFILVNSISGIAGQLSAGIPEFPLKTILILSGAVLTGGQLGTRISAYRVKGIVVRRLTGILVLYVALKLMNQYLFHIV